MKPFILWLMGPTSSGKSTLAEFFVAKWQQKNIPIIHYDGDEVREFFGKDHGFNPEDRMRVVDVLIHLTKKAHGAGLNTVVSALTANENARQRIIEELDELVIGFVSCPINICAERDPKGLYLKAQEGKIDTLIGWNVPYTSPNNPDLILDTESYQPEALFKLTNEYLINR